MLKEKPVPQAFHDFYKTNGEDFTVYSHEPSLTRQEFAEDCDINVIMQRYERTGMLPSNGAVPMYVDFTSMPNNLMDTMRLFDDAQAAFMTLPAKVRKEFDNDPAAFVDYAADPANLDQMREWGLSPMPAEPPVVPDSASAAPPPGGSPAAPSPSGGASKAPEGASGTVAT